MRTLRKPARVMHTTFGIGVDEELVIDAAQRAFEQGFSAFGWASVNVYAPPVDEELECCVVVDGEQERRFLRHDGTVWTDADEGRVVAAGVRVTHWRLPTQLPGSALRPFSDAHRYS